MQLTFKLLHTNFSIQYQILPADDDLPSLSAERITAAQVLIKPNMQLEVLKI